VLDLPVELRDITFGTVLLRMLMAVGCGFVIGLERTVRRRTAGLRTHILICLGAAITTLTSQYLFLGLHLYTDIARLGAQVIAGLGFIGAGTIIVTRHQRVKGLTTAAGLWTCGIIGLAIGSGFYEGAIIATGLMLFAELFLTRFEHNILDRSRDFSLYIEYDNTAALNEIITQIRQENFNLLNIEVARPNVTKKHNAFALIALRETKNARQEDLVEEVRRMEGVVSVELM
jgi:putative Mg2+ transporter-C (MgtC) family protein